MRIAKKITGKAIRDAIKAGRFSIFSGTEGLYLQLKSVKQPMWRYRYDVPTQQGKKQTISFGPLDRVSIEEAINLAQEARKALAAGVDPLTARKAHRTESDKLFRAVAREWLEAKTNAQVWGGKHLKDTEQKLQLHILPILGDYAATTSWGTLSTDAAVRTCA